MVRKAESKWEDPVRANGQRRGLYTGRRKIPPDTQTRRQTSDSPLIFTPLASSWKEPPSSRGGEIQQMRLGGVRVSTHQIEKWYSKSTTKLHDKNRHQGTRSHKKIPEDCHFTVPNRNKNKAIGIYLVDVEKEKRGHK